MFSSSVSQYCTDICLEQKFELIKFWNDFWLILIKILNWFFILKLCERNNVKNWLKINKDHFRENQILFVDHAVTGLMCSWYKKKGKKFLIPQISRKSLLQISQNSLTIWYDWICQKTVSPLRTTVILVLMSLFLCIWNIQVCKDEGGPCYAYLSVELCKDNNIRPAWYNQRKMVPVNHI